MTAGERAGAGDVRDDPQGFDRSGPVPGAHRRPAGRQACPAGRDRRMAANQRAPVMGAGGVAGRGEDRGAGDVGRAAVDVKR